MDTGTQSHLTTLRNLLTYRLHELETELHAAELARRAHGADAGVGQVSDTKDEAADFAVATVDDAEEARDLDEKSGVERALQRLDKGAYGDCMTCGEPIPLQRLLAQPAAERCAACQSAHERRA